MINERISSHSQAPARVVWCKELKNTNTFRYGVGVEFLQAPISAGSTAFLPMAPRMKNPGKQEGGTVIQMSKRSPKE